ncbi:MetS family NSS transporter small subunit [Clostridium rectalis]
MKALEIGSILMLLFGTVLLYGGLVFFIIKAIKSEKRKK